MICSQVQFLTRFCGKCLDGPIAGQQHLVKGQAYCGLHCPVHGSEVQEDPERAGIVAEAPQEKPAKFHFNGFVSDSRFGPGQVIKRTNRAVTRKWRRAGGGL